MERFTNLEKQTDHYTTRTYRLDRMGNSSNTSATLNGFNDPPRRQQQGSRHYRPPP